MDSPSVPTSGVRLNGPMLSPLITGEQVAVQVYIREGGSWKVRLGVFHVNPRRHETTDWLREGDTVEIGGHNYSLCRLRKEENYLKGSLVPVEDAA
jgi:hypothetical protein